MSARDHDEGYVDAYPVSLWFSLLPMWAPAAITTASKPYPSGRHGRKPQDYVDLSTAKHAAVQGHSLIVSLTLPGLHYKE